MSVKVIDIPDHLKRCSQMQPTITITLPSLNFSLICNSRIKCNAISGIWFDIFLGLAKQEFLDN
jgi:hypothetical protein